MTERAPGEQDGSFAAALVEESPDALIALSPEGRILFWSRGAEAIFGYTAKESVGRLLEELVVPAHRVAESRRKMGEALEKGEVLFETVRRRKDGSFVDVDVSKRVVRDAEGRIRFIASNKKDVTQLKTLRQERATEARFRGLLEAAPDAMVIVGRRRPHRPRQRPDREGLRLPARRAARPAHRGAGARALPRRRTPTRRGGLLQADPRTRPMGAGLELFGRRKDGSEFPAEISLDPDRDRATGGWSRPPSATSPTGARWRRSSAGCWRRPPTRS